MTIPDRSADVRAICERHPEAFPQTDQNDTARLVLLRGVIIPTLNERDEGRWGYLTKTDQRLPDGGYKVPCDIVMDRISLITVDCMTGDGACWIPHDPPPPEWEWTAVPAIGQPVRPAGADLSEPVFYEPATLAESARVLGTIVPQPDGWVVLITPTGQVISPQPDGRLELREAVGGYERAKRVGPTLLRYDGTGKTFYLDVSPRIL